MPIDNAITALLDGGPKSLSPGLGPWVDDVGLRTIDLWLSALPTVLESRSASRFIRRRVSHVLGHVFVRPQRFFYPVPDDVLVVPASSVDRSPSIRIVMVGCQLF